MISRRQLLVLAGAVPFWPALKSSAGVQSTPWSLYIFQAAAAEAKRS